MEPFANLTSSEKKSLLSELRAEFDRLCGMKLKLNMARGKPGTEQLNQVSGILTVLTDPADCLCDGIDARNYGNLSGLPAAKELFADILGCKPEQCFIGGCASLQLMYDLIAKAWTHGLRHSPRPWSQEPKVKWLCPAPGYDRHFGVSKSFGMEMITVRMTPAGPDMDLVEELVKDPAVKGIWCVPKYSNPQGFVYSERTIARIAALKPAAPDFAVMWDNAYCVHEVFGDYLPFPDILSICAEAGNPDLVYEFASTSKITFPGAGVSAMACSEENQAYLQGLLKFQIISYDKVNQLRHVRFLQNKAHTIEVMQQHARILAPKFNCVLENLRREIGPLGLASWEEPKGGYFISVDTLPGLAKRTLELCAQAGVTMTAAGATFPYGKDPNDSNIRIAPSYPALDELQKAMEVFCLCLKLAALEKLC